MPINPTTHPTVQRLVNDINAAEQSAVAVLLLAIVDVLTDEQLAKLETIVNE